MMKQKPVETSAVTVHLYNTEKCVCVSGGAEGGRTEGRVRERGGLFYKFLIII